MFSQSTHGLCSSLPEKMSAQVEIWLLIVSNYKLHAEISRNITASVHIDKPGIVPVSQLCLFFSMFHGSLVNDFTLYPSQNAKNFLVQECQKL